MNNMHPGSGIDSKTVPMVLALAPVAGCSSGGQPRPHPVLLIKETPISDDRSRITIQSNTKLYSASVLSMMTMCKCARLKTDRGFRYFYTDEKIRATQPDGQPRFRITFYKSPPEGMTVYPAEGVSILSPEAGESMDGFDPDSTVIDAEGIEPACTLFYQRL